MADNYRCWKLAQACDDNEQKVLCIGDKIYTLQDVTGKEIRLGTDCLCKWFMDRKYKTQVAGLGRVYYEIRSEFQNLSFEELIFSDGECIGVYHDELVFLFDDEKTRSQKKYLGSVPTGHDQEIDYYDYYDLKSK